jgi:ketosteroid isomerase-like protein
MKLKLTLVVIGILLVSSLALTSCGGNPALDVVNKFIKAEDQMFSTGDGSGLLAVEDENIVIHMMSFGDTKGNAGHVAAIKGIVDGAASPITHEWFNITATGDTASVRWTEKGMVGGKELVYDGAYFLKVKDGKIVEAWLISDMLSYFLAAGIVQYAPPPAQ